jgi:hypothetical protein
MAQTIEVPGQGPVEFPDGMSDADIVSAIKKLSGTKQPLSQRVGDALKMNPGEALGSAGYQIGGKVTDLSAQFGNPPEVAAGIGYAANVGFQAMPTLLGMMAGGGPKIDLHGVPKGISGQSMMRGAAEGMMENALKPTYRDLVRGNAKRAVGTLLDEGISPTEGGIAQLRAKALGLNKNVDDAIASAQGATIPKGAPANRIQAMIAKLEQENALPNAPRAAMEQVYDEFLSNPLVSQNIPVSRAQQYKQTLYQDLKNKYGVLSEGSEGAKKALALGLKEEIEAAVPAVGPLNAKASDLWNALNVAERRALLQAGADPVGIAFMAANPKAAAAFMANKNPYIKSIIARSLNALSTAVPSGIQTGLMVGQQSSGAAKAVQMQNEGAQ